MTVKVFVDPKQRGKLSVRERLRCLLRQNERRNPHRQQQNQQRTNLHFSPISTDLADFRIILSSRTERSAVEGGRRLTNRIAAGLKAWPCGLCPLRCSLDFARNDSSLCKWNLKKTRFSSARTRRL